jgi:nucleotide-binding universal stress UspA family protein
METTGVPSGAIVVGLDGSPPADRALDWAIDQAVCEGRPLTLAHGVELAGSAWIDPAGPDHRAVLDVVDDDAAVLLERAHRRVAERAPELPVHRVVRQADAGALLAELSERAAIVVVGSRGRGPVRSLLLGSVGLTVVRHASCPVVVVRPGNPGIVRNGVLVGADGSQGSLPTVELGYRQAALHRLPLTIMHCFRDARSGEREAVRLELAESVSGLAEKFPEVSARYELACGRADVLLARASARMNLVVLGAHHGAAMSEILPGSVATSVLEHATCPVAILPVGCWTPQ